MIRPQAEAAAETKKVLKEERKALKQEKKDLEETTSGEDAKDE